MPEFSIRIHLLLTFTISFGQFINVPILYSKYTPQFMVDFLMTEFNCPDLNSAACIGNPYAFFIPIEVNDANDVLEYIVGQDLLMLYDITCSSVINAYIDAFAMQYLFLHLVSGYTPKVVPPLDCYDHTKHTLIKDASIALVKHFGWQKVVIFLSQEFTEMDFQAVTDVEIVFITILPSAISYETIYIIVSKEVKPLGVRTMMIATNLELSKLIQKAIIEAEMNTKDYNYIFLVEAAWSAHLEGALLLEEYIYSPKNLEEYCAYIINFSVTFLQNLMQYYPIQGSFSLYTFYEFILTYVNLERFHLFNIQNNELVLVGNITDRIVTFYSAPIFMGNTTMPVDNTKIKLPISISGGYTNPDGSTYTYNAECQYGSDFAIEAINNKFHILENFDLVINNITDCGASYFDSEYATKCFSKHFNDLGYFHIPSQQISMIDGTMTVFKNLNISVPVLGVQASNSLNNDYYPQYTSISFSNTYTANAIVFLLASYRINRVSLLHLDTPSGRNFKNQFLSQAEAYKIEILNKNQAIPSGYNGTDISMLQEIIDIKSRYIIVEVTNTEVFSLINIFYELGMRKGDLYLIFAGGLSFSNSDINEEKYNQLLEIVDGSLYITFLSYYGAYGKQIYDEFLHEYGITYDYMCLFYDATYLGSYAIDSMISRGFNLNSSGIEEWVRKVQIKGCSGNVQISKSGNDRSTIKVGVYNLKLNSTSWNIILSGIHDPTKIVVLEALADVSWYTENDGVLPSEIIGDDLSCPFKSKEVRSFPDGYLILLIIGGAFIIFDIGFIYKSFNKSVKKTYLQLQCKTEENVLDHLQYFIMLIECLQYIAIGPDFKDVFPDSLNRVTKISTIDLRGWNVKYDWKFWYQITLIDSIIGLWLILLLASHFDFWKKWTYISFVTISSEIGKIFLPIIGDILFLPIIWFLLLTFQCTKSIGKSFTSSFHNQDCTVSCWEDEHIKYVIGSIFGILLYLPTSIHFRPSWKDDTGDVVFHFKEQPCHSLVKSFMQIVLVILNVMLLPYSNIAYTVCFVFIIGVFGAYTLFRKPYNYDRASLWYTLFIFSCVWLWICCEVGRFNAIFAECIVGTGWILLGIIGIIYQKKMLPSYLESPKGQDILRLFKFQLSRKSPFQAGIQSSARYSYVDISSSEAKNEVMSENIYLQFPH